MTLPVASKDRRGRILDKSVNAPRHRHHHQNGTAAGIDLRAASPGDHRRGPCREPQSQEAQGLKCRAARPACQASNVRKKGIRITAPVARYAATPARSIAIPSAACPLPARQYRHRSMGRVPSVRAGSAQSVARPRRGLAVAQRVACEAARKSTDCSEHEKGRAASCPVPGSTSARSRPAPCPRR